MAINHPPAEARQPIAAARCFRRTLRSSNKSQDPACPHYKLEVDTFTAQAEPSPMITHLSYCFIIICLLHVGEERRGGTERRGGGGGEERKIGGEGSGGDSS